MVTVRPRPVTTNLRCAVCHDDARGASACPGCATVVHEECRGLAAGCPTLGCAAVARAAPPGPLLELPRWYQPVSIAAGVLVVGALVVGVLTKFKDALGHGDEAFLGAQITSPIQ